jgi:hypothetical protein
MRPVMWVEVLAVITAVVLGLVIVGIIPIQN